MRKAAPLLLRAFDEGEQVAPLSDTAPINLAEGYAISAEIAAARIARGETPVGRKIGFTNRTIWPIYNVDAPVWSYVYGTGLHDIPASGEISLPGLPELRLEPEIIFGFNAPPRADMSKAELWQTVAWVSHGIELVTSPYPGWRFTAPDAAAAQAMHGSLWIGARLPAAALDPAMLSAFEIALEGPGASLKGHASDVLGGPLSALSHLLKTIADMPGASPIAAGECVSTGTLTDAVPIAPGERWRTTFTGCPLPGLDISLV